MCKIVINSLYEDLLESFADLNQMKQVVNHAFKREFEALDLYGQSDTLGNFVSREAFLFNNPFTGQREKYAFRTTTIEDLRLLTYWHKNSQYCWLLMSAYEKFEQYLKAVYNEANVVVGKKLDMKGMLSYFSSNFPSVKTREEKNKSEIHLRIAVLLIEKMRHVITHNQGVVLDEKAFFRKIINDSGIANDRDFYEKFVSQFIHDGKVFILEVPANNHAILKTYYDQYGRLVSYLIAYAYLINDAVTPSVP